MDWESWINDDEIDVKKAFFDNSDPTPKITRRIIENELSELIDCEFPKTESYNIILTERKGLFLFHPLLDRLKHNGVSSIKLFKVKAKSDIEITGKLIRNNIIFDPKPGCSTVILTDAIGHGNELNELLEVMNIPAITKVVAYIAKKEGYEKLKENYPTIDFRYKIPIENSAYLAGQRRLQTVYQSRMERMDEEHPVIKFKIEPTIPIPLLNRMIRSAIVSFYEGEIDYSNDNLGIDVLQGFTVTFFDVKKILNMNFQIDPSHMKLDRVQLRFRYCQETSCLSVMGLALPDSCTSYLKFNLYRALIGRCHLRIPFKLCKTLSPISKSHVAKICSIIYKRNPHPFCDIYCPYCVDLNVSQDLFYRFFIEFSKKMTASNFKCEQVRDFENCE